MDKVIFRVDISQSTGIGHIRRCEALASALNDLNVESVFILNEAMDEDLLRVYKNYDLPYRKHFLSQFLSTDYSNDDAQREIDEINNFAVEENSRTIVLDSYQINDSKYIARLRSYGFFVVTIDDLADMSFPSDLVVNGSAGAKYLNYKSSTDETVFLLGLEYFLLRPEFKYHNYQINNEVNNILITMGGSDSSDNTSLIIKLLENRISERDFKLKVVLGPFYDNHVNIELLSKNSKRDIEIIDSPTNMRSIMESVDLAISAAGQTIYELCALGVPAVAIQSAENQSSNINELSRLGAIYSIRSSPYSEYGDTVFESEFKNCIRTLIYDYDVRKNISDIAKKLVDGNGPERVGNHILKYGS